MSYQTEFFRSYYSSKSDGELIRMARTKDSLVSVARTALDAELLRRGLDQKMHWPPRSSMATPKGSADSLQVIDISRISRAAGLVSLANYFLVLVGLNEALNIVAHLLSGQRSIGSTAILLAEATVYSYCGWVGWKNIGVLSTSDSPSRICALAAFAVTNLSNAIGEALSLRTLDLSGDDGVVFFLNVALNMFYVSVCLGFGVGILYLRRLSVPRLNIKVTELLGDKISWKVNTAARLSVRAPWTGAAYLLGGTLWLGAFSLISSSPFALHNTYVFQLANVGYVLLVYANQFLQPDFETVTSGDRRLPVVFLRSFIDDEKVLENPSSSLFGFSLELRLARYFHKLGPFVAVGAPGDKTPHLGAVRAKLTDIEWQGRVLQWINESALIVSVAGISEWAAWELKQIIELAQVRKLLVVFPYIADRRWLFRKRDHNVELRLRLLQQVFVGTAWESGLSQVREPQLIKGLVFSPDGRVTAVTSKARNLDAYVLAALLEHYLILHWQSDEQHGADQEGFPTRNRRSQWAMSALAPLAAGVVGFFLMINGGSGIVSLATPKPIPPSFLVKSVGSLAVGNFDYVDDTTALPRSYVFRPGEKVSLAYEVTGFRLDSAGRADVNCTTVLLDAGDNPQSQQFQTRFNKAFSLSGHIRSTFKTTLSEEAESGDYRFDIKVHDAVSGSDLEFRPLMRVETR